MAWRKAKSAPISDTVVFVYFNELVETMAPTTLWSIHSMLRSTLLINHKIDIAKFGRVTALLKRHSDGYEPNKAKVLSEEDEEKFLRSASDVN